jgi:predicted DNA binding CopG/RHH family protein
MRLSKETPPRLPGETARYEDDPFELGEIADSQFVQVADFLPRPEELVFRPKGVKVTITLNEESVNFFKAEAKRLRVPYQRMIRNLLDEYVARIKQAEQKHSTS